MEKKLDLRIQKTYLALTAALLSMMEEKRFEDIRIGGLCDRAMVRKSTLYKHFGDKYELLAFVVRQKQESLNARLAAQRVEGDTVEYYTRLIGLVFDFLADNEALARTAIQSNSFPLILSILSEQIIRDIQQQLKGDARRGGKAAGAAGGDGPVFRGGHPGDGPQLPEKGQAPQRPRAAKPAGGAAHPLLPVAGRRPGAGAMKENTKGVPPVLARRLLCKNRAPGGRRKICTIWLRFRLYDFTVLL